MASSAPRPNVRTDPVIEVARRGAVRLALVGGMALVVGSIAQLVSGDQGGLLTLMGALPTAGVAAMMTRQERPNVILLLAMISALAIGAEAYAAWNGQTEYVVGIGSEAVVIGLGILAVFVAREHPAPIGAGFVAATMVPIGINQLHLNGLTWEIVTDMVVVISVMGTLIYLVIRVLDSLSESQTRYSDLASVIPVATFEFDLSRVVARIDALGQGRANREDTADRQDEIYAELMPLLRLSFFNDMADAMVAAYGTWYQFALGKNAENLQLEAIKILSSLWRGAESGGGGFTARKLDGTGQDFIYRWAFGRPRAGSSARLVLAATDVTRLREAEAALEQQLRERDQFVASVSHELRTPLTSIMGLTEELVSRPGDFAANEQAELLGIVAAETRDVVDIVEDLLVTARAEAGQLNINLEPCDLAAEMYRVAELLGGKATAADPVWTSADAGRLRQVLRNLLSNAHRHGGPDVRMTVSTADDAAVFEIRDDGDPLPHAERERIFMAYERAGGQGPVGSVGLGLHVARLLVRLMGGELEYRHDGTDAIFRLELPLIARPAVSADGIA
jgi:signal transduction histidine kinase